IRDAIRGYAERAGDAVDLRPALASADALVAETEQLRRAIAGGEDEAAAERINACLMALGRLLTPINYSEVSPYEHDLALPLLAVPLLKGANELAPLDPASDEFKFLRTRLLRNQNRVVHALDQAVQAVRETLAALPAGAGR